jgi:hypothetical protein
VTPAPVGKVAAASAAGWADVTADSATDAWAVYSESDLIEHWDGQSWSVSQPNRDKQSSYGRVLQGVAAVSPSAAWAVGFRTVRFSQTSMDNPSAPLIESWDGTSWHVDRTPRLPRGSWLNSVVAVAANDVWAVGVRAQRAARGVINRTLIEHWDGSSWRVVPSPNIGRATYVWRRFDWTPASDNELVSVAAVSADDIWAVGDAGRAVRRYKNDHTLILSPFKMAPLAEHWDGTAWKLGPPAPWTVHPSPYQNEIPSQDGFTDVTATAAGDVLALAPSGGLFDHAPKHTPGWQLTGSAWTPTYHARHQKDIWWAGAIIATDHHDAWIIGNQAPGSPTFDNFAVWGVHWDGQHWSRTPRLPAGGELTAAATSGPDDIWVVGRFGGPSNPMLHYTC